MIRKGPIHCLYVENLLDWFAIWWRNSVECHWMDLTDIARDLISFCNENQNNAFWIDERHYCKNEMKSGTMAMGEHLTIVWTRRRSKVNFYHTFCIFGNTLRDTFQYKIRTIAGCACAGNECRERFPHHPGLTSPICITERPWCTCRDACRDG